ncbi:MAG TPA: hypothetical protein DEA28_01295 [Firmicutes bacterium]|nr:hypothetical protein [Bacillota bacterium]
MMHNFLYYSGLILILGSIICSYLFINFTNKEKNISDLQIILKKTWVFGLLGISLFALAFILLDWAFFIDEATLNNLKTLNKSLNPGLVFLSFFFGSLFVIAIHIFAYSFYFYWYFPKEEKKRRKLFLVIYTLSAVIAFISFILFSEGNAQYLIYPLANIVHIGKGGFFVLTRNGSELSQEGGLNIALYALCILSGAILVLFICDHFTYKYYGKHGLLYTCFLFAFPSGIIGARLWYVCIDIGDNGVNSQFIQRPLSIFEIWNGGLAIMGGAILGIIVGVSVILIYKYALKNKDYTKINLLFLVDYIIPTILIAQAIGRWGNFFNNEVNGNLYDIKYFNWLPTFIRNQMQYANHATWGSNIDHPGMIYLPLFFIEFCTNLIGYFTIYFGFGRGNFSKLIISLINKIKPGLIKAKFYHPNGACVGGYLIWYGTTRIILEPLRTGSDFYKSSLYSAYGMVFSGILIIIIAILWDYFITRKGVKNIILKDEDLN